MNTDLDGKKHEPYLSNGTELITQLIFLFPLNGSNKVVLACVLAQLVTSSLKIGKTKVIGFLSSTVTLTVVVVPDEISN